MNYSKALKQLRKAMHITQKDLSEQIGFNVTTLNRWEGGKANSTNTELFKIKKFCKENNINMEEYEI